MHFAIFADTASVLNHCLEEPPQLLSRRCPELSVHPFELRCYLRDVGRVVSCERQELDGALRVPEICNLGCSCPRCPVCRSLLRPRV